MSPKTSKDSFVFFVETNFQRMARRPGGVSREKAIESASTALEKLKPDFHDWLDDKLVQLTEAVKGARASTTDSSKWIDAANQHSHGLRDVGSTLGFELVGYVANSLCEMLTADDLNVTERIEAIECHVQALLLVRQERFQSLLPSDVPELIEGLRRVAKSLPVRP